MLVNGEWLPCDDGELRPLVPGMVRLSDGDWLEVTFLLDAGSDRTVFSARLLHWLRHLEVADPASSHLSGVGGEAGAITIETTISFIKDDGRPAIVRGTFGVFTDSESADLSVLGRDVTNNFSVIYDYHGRTIALLAAPHFYEIKRST
jgi:hypothetical protein